MYAEELHRLDIGMEFEAMFPSENRDDPLGITCDPVLALPVHAQSFSVMFFQNS